MLSRVAERVYWMARYLERVENTARLINVYSNLLLDLPRGTKVGWHSLIDISGSNELFAANHRIQDERTVVKFLIAEPNGSSILSTISMARENARTTREVIPAEAFEQINELYLFIKEGASGGISRGPRNILLEEIIIRCQQLVGLLMGTMSHNHVHKFIRIGRNVERADMTTRIVDVGSGTLLPALHSKKTTESEADHYQDLLWMSVLRSLSAYQMYRQHVQDRVNAEDVVMFLLQDEQFPRSVSCCLIRLKSFIGEFSNNHRALRQVNKVLRQVQTGKIPKLLAGGLFQYVDELQIEIADIHNQIVDTWFLPHN